MSKEIKVQFPSVMEFLGWHGTFLLGTIVIFKLLLDSLGASACPCSTGQAVYGSVMLGLPAVSIFVVAFFSYFYQEDTQSPWKDLKAYYKLKSHCSYSPTSQNWELHSGVFHQCTECQGKWRKIKITVSFFISLVYPMLWLALGFRQVTYYACATVGADPNGIIQYCDISKHTDTDTYEKKYYLAMSKSLLVGNVLLVVVIASASAIFITYRLISRKIADITEDIEDGERSLQNPINNFGHVSEAIVNPNAHARMPGAMTRSTEGGSPVSGKSYEGFRELSGDVNRGRASSRDTQPLIKVDS